MSRAARRLGAVLHNFLATYTSRYSGRDGFWIFGFVIQELAKHEADLLAEGPAHDAVLLARSRFRDQLAKSRGIGPVTAATLIIEREQPAEQVVNNAPRRGHMLSLTVRARAGTQEAERNIRIFVAPHDPQLEHRSYRPKT